MNSNWTLINWWIDYAWRDVFFSQFYEDVISKETSNKFIWNEDTQKITLN